MLHKPHKPTLLVLVQVICTEGDTVQHVSEHIFVHHMRREHTHWVSHLTCLHWTDSTKLTLGFTMTPHWHLFRAPIWWGTLLCLLCTTRCLNTTTVYTWISTVVVNSGVKVWFWTLVQTWTTLNWTQSSVQNSWTEPKVQFRVQAIREGFKSEPNFELQCRKILPKFKKSFYFRYWLSNWWQCNVICY